MADASEQSVVWVRRLAAGEDAIVCEFWNRYGESLQRLARSRMAPALQQRLGAEDIVQSVCRTFFRRARKGEFELPGTDQLWRLLCAITLTKVRQHARFHYAIQRTPELEVPLGADKSPSDLGGDERRLRPHEPTPAEVVEFAEAMQRLFGALTKEEQDLVHYRLEGLTQIEIAEKQNCSERTVRRLLDRIRARWESELESSLSQ
jgi:RNA polymerase sigma-70 factor (ECF subfamily)